MVAMHTQGCGGVELDSAEITPDAYLEICLETQGTPSEPPVPTKIRNNGTSMFSSVDEGMTTSAFTATNDFAAKIRLS